MTLMHWNFKIRISSSVLLLRRMEAIVATVTDAMLSAFFRSLFDTLSSPVFLKFSRKEQIAAEIKKWEKLLLKLDALLEDAEEKQITSRAVRLWLSDLQDVAFDAEDVVDALATEAFRRKQMEQSKPSACSKVWKFILPTCFSAISPRTIKFNADMMSKIKEITTRWQDLAALKNDLNLMEIGAGSREKVLQRLPTTSLVDESLVYGRKKDKDAILDLLMDDGQCQMGSGEVDVVPIVGMAGVGKTTLAQLVYNDVKIEASFELRAWVCVGEEFDVLKVTKKVLDAVSSNVGGLNDLNQLQVRLKEKLLGIKFLIILDDIWNENYEKWDILCRPFAAGATGSKIVVTTRHKRVAEIMSNCQAYYLNELSNDDCLALFTWHALRARNFDGHPNLKVVGEQIVRKCKGLPLVAKTLGGLLRTKVNQDEWKDILMSKMWDLPEERSSILPALRLSYHYLPSYLKRCFAYCSIFPKDYEFDKDELVRLWMAEGFLQPPRGKIQMEDLGVKYFNELLSRSFFQQSSSKKTRFVMHDLINDLAQSVSGGICYDFNDVDVLKGDKLCTNAEKIRHLSFTRKQYDFTKRFEILYQMKNLRTLTALPTYMQPSAACCYLSSDVLYNLLSSLRCLRVLSLSCYCINELPDSIGHLKHLRYLNLSCSRIKQLPESVGSLFNLQTLILQGCTQLSKLPEGINNLVNLRVLDLTDTSNLQEMPFHIGNLKNLQILSKLIVGKGIGSAISELSGLLHLRGQLSILGLEKVDNIQDASNANIRDKHGLTGLDLQWSRDHLNSQNKENQLHVLDRLLPHKDLEKLRILFYGGKILPYWLSDPSLTNIVYLELCNCRNCISLPSLGRLTSLKTLSIAGMDSVQKVGFEFYGHSYHVKPFVSLESLLFKDMLEWTCWSTPSQANEDSGEEFPCLKELLIENCPKLSGKLPGRLFSLVKLVIKHCPKLEGSSMSFPSLCEVNMEDCSEELLGSIVGQSTQTTQITSMPELQCLQNGRVQFTEELKVLAISNCAGLTSLWQKEAIVLNIASLKLLKIKSCLKFVSLTEHEQGLSNNLEDLRLLKSSNLQKPPWRMQDFTSLEDLQIVSCPNLVSFPVKDFPPMLKNLKLRDCRALKSLPGGMMMPDCLLKQLVIEYCPALTCFPSGRLPISLRRLKILHCTDLISLPEGLMQTSDRTSNISYLENLEIIDCPSLISFPEGKLPASLKILNIWNCYQLEPFSDRILHENASLESIDIWNWTKTASLPECLHSLNHLTELNLRKCPALEYFPETGLHLLNLRKFYVYKCINLKSLPDQMLRLTSLQYLTICECPGLQSLPKGGLPPNLLSLEIGDCENLKQPTSEWNLHRLTSLRELSITGASDTTSFPDENCLLPETLVSMFISGFHNLRSISMGLSNLNLLEELEIVECPKLQSLPVEGLPVKLGKLCIRDCHLLEKHCLKGRGAFWPLIAHMPLLEIGTVDD